MIALNRISRVISVGLIGLTAALGSGCMPDLMDGFTLCASVYRMQDGERVPLEDSYQGNVRVQWLADGSLKTGNIVINDIIDGYGCAEGTNLLGTEAGQFELKSMRMQIDGETAPGVITHTEEHDEGKKLYVEADFVIGEEENTEDPAGVQAYMLRSLLNEGRRPVVAGRASERRHPRPDGAAPAGGSHAPSRGNSRSAAG